MKRLILALIVAVALALATVSPALAVTLTLPNGDTVEGLPEGAANAGNAGLVEGGGSQDCPPNC